MDPSSLAAKLAANYVEALYWRITDRSDRLAKMNVVALLLAVISGFGFFWLARQFGRAPKLAWSGPEIGIFAVGLVAVLGFHEWVHGVLMRAYGAKPRYGFFARGGMFYAKAPGHAFTRRQYLVVVLGPLVGLSLLAVVGIGLMQGTPWVWVVSLWAIINASAASADVWITALLLNYPAAAYVVDERDGMRILVPTADMPTRSAGDRPY